MPTEQLLVRGLSSEPSSSHASEPSSEPRSGVVRKSRGERLAEPERLGLVGSVIDARYRIDAVLGEGGSGLVFAATRLADHAQVALKVLHARHAGNAVFVRAFEREAAIASQLRVDGVVRCLDRGLLADGSPYAIFERVDGIGLSRLAKRLGGLRQREAIAIVMRVAETLETLHRHGVVHRDIKPEHIVVRAGERGQLEVSLLDLGTCVTLDARDEIARDSGGYAVGTPEYMAPEQARGEHEVDGRIDVYALGVVLYQMLSGRMPFESASRRTMLERVVSEDPPRLALIAPHVSLSLDAVISQAMERDARARFSSMGAFIAALRPFAKERVHAEQRLFWLVAERPRVARRGRIITARSGARSERSIGRVLELAKG